MTVGGRRVTVTTTATRLDSGDESPNSGGKSLAIKPASTIDIGASDVTSGAGFEVGADGISVDLESGDAVYGIAASGTVAVQVFETGI